MSYSVIPSLLIIGSNALLLYEFVQSKKRVHGNSSLIRINRVRKDIRATFKHAFVFSFSFVACSLPKMLTLFISFITSNNSDLLNNLSTIFNLLGNVYYVFNFFILLFMNTQFFTEFNLIVTSIFSIS